MTQLGIAFICRLKTNRIRLVYYHCFDNHRLWIQNLFHCQIRSPIQPSLQDYQKVFEIRNCSSHKIKPRHSIPQIGFQIDAWVMWISAINLKTGLSVKKRSSPIRKHIRWAFKRSPALLIICISCIIISIDVWVNASGWFISFLIIISTFFDSIQALLFWTKQNENFYSG